MKLRTKALLSGLGTYIPLRNKMDPTGGTDSARYCYSVWLRHLTLSNSAASKATVPTVVAELGPGDSIGIGLAALLSGAEKYFAFDAVSYSDLRRNLSIFDELVELFRRREPIPGGEEFPSVKPVMTELAFPSALLGENLLARTLDERRVADIRASIENSKSSGSRISYHAPWTSRQAIEPGTVDMIYSQAVLEHVADMDEVYGAMRQWLKPDGHMSHQIDYRCHGWADTWNGHWTFSDLEWKIVVGRRPFLINRAPHSEQMQRLRAAGFEVLRETKVRSESILSKDQLAKRFRNISDEDLVTSGAYVVSRPLRR